MVPERYEQVVDAPCDRCKKPIDGLKYDHETAGYTIGFYELGDSWGQFANPGESRICEPCMWSDPRYIAVYGDHALRSEAKEGDVPQLDAVPADLAQTNLTLTSHFGPQTPADPDRMIYQAPEIAESFPAQEQEHPAPAEAVIDPADAPASPEAEAVDAEAAAESGSHA